MLVIQTKSILISSSLLLETQQQKASYSLTLTKPNERLDFQTLVAHFEGTGVHLYDITRADRILESLHYAGEKRSLRSNLTLLSMLMTRNKEDKYIQTI